MCEKAEAIKKDYHHIDKIKRIVPPNKLEFYIKIVDNWLQDYQDGVFLLCETNNIDDCVVALYHYNAIYLLGETYQTVMYAPKILFHMIDAHHLHIDDILMKHNNVGNGSIAMRSLFIYAKMNNVNCITGTLSKIDDDHKSRRDHYYKKFGFDVGEHSISIKI